MMNVRFSSLAIASGLLASTSTCALAQTYTLPQFTHHATIESPANGRVARVTLPPEAMRASQHVRYADIGVFNAVGEPVPFSILTADLTKAGAGAQVALVPISISRAEQVKRSGHDEIISETKLDGVLIERVRGQAALRVSVTGAAASAAAAPKAGEQVWNFAVMGDTESLDTLVFDLADSAPAFAMPVRVEASTDLMNWTLVAQGVAFRENIAGTMRESLRINGTGARTRFVRITASTQGALPREALRGVLIEHPSGISAPLPAASLTVPLRAGANANEWTADLGGRFPVTATQIQFPQVDAAAQVQLSARSAAADAWKPLAAGFAHRVAQNGITLNNAPLLGAQDGVREVRATFEPKIGAVGDGMSLTVSYLPAEISFGAQGAGPYTLGVGLSAKDIRSQAISHDKLVANWTPALHAGIPVANLAPVRANANVAPVSASIAWHKLALGIGGGLAALAGLGFGVRGWLASKRAPKERVGRA